MTSSLQAVIAACIVATAIPAAAAAKSSSTAPSSCFRADDETGDQAVFVPLGDTEGYGLQSMDIDRISVATAGSSATIRWRLADLQRPPAGVRFEYSFEFAESQADYALIVQVGEARLPSAVGLGDNFYLSRGQGLNGQRPIPVRGWVDIAKDEVGAVIAAKDLGHSSFKGVTLLHPTGFTIERAGQVGLYSDNVSFPHDLRLGQMANECRN